MVKEEADKDVLWIEDEVWFMGKYVIKQNARVGLRLSKSITNSSIRN